MNILEFLDKQSSIELPNNKPGPGKKKCNCGLYLGVRTKICKSCGWNFSTSKKVEIPELIIPPPVYVYEHLRTDSNRDREQAALILSKKDVLAEKQNEFYYAPTQWRPLCYSIEEVLNRRIPPYDREHYLKDEPNKIIIKCIKTDNYFKPDDPKFGSLQQLIVVGVIDV